MPHNHHSPCYADRAWFGPVTIEENVRVAKDTHRLRIECPELAARIVPGQFVMLRLSRTDDPLLGRPLAMYDVVRGPKQEPRGLDIVYLAIGKMTRRLALLEPGQPLELWGPLGNGFPAVETDHLVMVAGGIGQTPFLTLAKEYLGLETYGDPRRQVPRARKVTLCYGSRSREHLAGVEDFRQIGVDVHISTDDGSAGRHGLVTALIEPVVASSPHDCRIVCCGPEPMMEATTALAQRLGIPCQVSLETPMACGIGICFSCVAKIRDAEGNWDYKRTCVEGPVFNAEDVDFSSAQAGAPPTPNKP
jgi:dihydroorotate dehydrogenase electron transfer subunit